jgi:hypothetical protein
MKTKSFIPAVVALTLLLSASSSMAATILGPSAKPRRTMDFF